MLADYLFTLVDFFLQIAVGFWQREALGWLPEIEAQVLQGD